MKNNAAARAPKKMFASTRIAKTAASGAALGARREWRARWMLALLCVLAYAPNIIAALMGALPFGEDTSALFGPWREYSRQALSAGVLPLWNARVFCGLPFLPNGQTSVLYFFNFVYWFLPLKAAFLLDAVGHNILLALGAFTLARALGQSRGAAFLAACALGLGGAVAAHANAGHTTWHAARAYIPWELWALLMFLRQRENRASRGYLLLLTLFFALQIFAGYPPLVLLGAALCCGLFLAYVASTRKWNWRWLQGAALVGGGVFLLSAAVLLPLREVSKLSAHGAGLEYEIAVVGSGTVRSIFRLMSPDFFGGNAALQWSTNIGAWEEAAYGGILVFVLAIGAPFFARLRTAKGWKLPRAVPWLWALLPLSLLLALGDNTPFYKVMFEHVALFRLTRVPVRWLEVWALSAALLAGFSFDALWRRATKTPREYSRGSAESPQHNAAKEDETATQNAFAFPDKTAKNSGAKNLRRDEKNFAATSQSQARVLALRVWMLRAALLMIIALMLGAAFFAATKDAQSEAWISRARAIFGGESRTEIVAAASGLRTRALLESLITCVIAALLCLYAARARARSLLLAIAVADVMLAFWKSAQPLPQSYLQNSVRWPAELTQRAKPDERWATNLSFGASNNNMVSGPDTVDGYDALSGAVHTDFISALEERKVWAAAYGPSRPNPLLRMAGVTHLLAQRAPEAQWKGRTVLHFQSSIGDWRLYRYNWTAWPREYLASRVLAAPREAQLSLLQSLCETPGIEANLPLVAAPDDFAAFGKNAISATSSNARVLAVTRGWNRSRVRIQTDASAVLVQADTLYPGWRAFVDGKPAKIAPANYLFRGVEVPPHSARVDLIYDSQTFRSGVFLSLCGLGFMIALTIGARPLRCN